MIVNNTINKINTQEVFKGKEGTLSVVTTLKFNILTEEVAVISKAVYFKGEIEELGSGTYQECYDICVAKKNELKPKVYNWENCAEGTGYYTNTDSEVWKGTIDSFDPSDKNVYPTKEDAESALAYCQLLHVVNAINEDYPKTGEGEGYTIYNCPEETTLKIAFSTANSGTLKLDSEEGAEILIRDNEELLRTYFKIK